MACQIKWLSSDQYKEYPKEQKIVLEVELNGKRLRIEISDFVRVTGPYVLNVDTHAANAVTIMLPDEVRAI